MKQDKATKKYFALYAEPEVRLAESLKWPNYYQSVLVIPALNESHEFIHRLQELEISNYADQNEEKKSLTVKKSILLIVIINQANLEETATSENHFTSNKKLDAYIQTHGTLISSAEQLYLYDFKNIDILIINRYSPGYRIPKKFGVGLARKIGCDIAALLIEERIVCTPLIFSSDADATLPKNYFHTSELYVKNDHKQQISALIFDFEHKQKQEDSQTSKQVYDATKIYEKLIHYYANRLKNAGSPYGFCALGSCLAVTQKHYCQARGFPKKPAGEDFYLLNKIAKLGRIEHLEQVKIIIETRLSNRVPFGTGPAAEKIMNTLADGQLPIYYDPRSFDCLGYAIQSIKQLTSLEKPKVDFETALLNICNNEQQAKCICDAFSDLGIDEFFAHTQKQNIDTSKLINTFHHWFDAFKTLKFIHYLALHCYPKIPIDNLADCSFENTYSNIYKT